MRQQKAAVRETLTRSLRWQACMPALTCVVVVRLCATSREVLGRFRWQISTLLCVVVADGENHCVSLTAACLLLTQGKAFGVVGSDGVIGMYDPRNLREVRTQSGHAMWLARVQFTHNLRGATGPVCERCGEWCVPTSHLD